MCVRTSGLLRRAKYGNKSHVEISQAKIERPDRENVNPLPSSLTFRWFGASIFQRSMISKHKNVLAYPALPCFSTWSHDDYYSLLIGSSHTEDKVRRTGLVWSVRDCDKVAWFQCKGQGPDLARPGREVT